MAKPRAFSIAAAIAVTAMIGGYAAFLAAQAPQALRVGSAHGPVWTEVKWPFPLDLWGPGGAFRCRAANCGSEVHLYLRAKIGFCNCATSIDDDMVDRVSDVDLLGGERAALDEGRPVDVRWMKGRSRGYAVSGRGATARSALAIALHERCDLIVATAAIGDDQPAAHEAAIVEFLKSDLVLRWAEVTLGL
jgi:hypothetical protein